MFGLLSTPARKSIVIVAFLFHNTRMRMRNSFFFGYFRFVPLLFQEVKKEQILIWSSCRKDSKIGPLRMDMLQFEECDQ